MKIQLMKDTNEAFQQENLIGPMHQRTKSQFSFFTTFFTFL